MKRILIFMILLLTPFVISQATIKNFEFDSIFYDIYSGETLNINFSFNYDGKLSPYIYPKDNAPLIIIVNISSENLSYPVNKGDFTLNGSMRMNKGNLFIDEYNFKCYEDQFILGLPYFPINITIPDGIYYCTDNNYLKLKSGTNNHVMINIKSREDIYPGDYDITMGLYYPEKEMFDFILSSPIKNNLYLTRMILINLTVNEKAKFVRYKDNNNKFINICTNCMKYSQNKPFDDGWHNLSIEAVFNSGVKYYDVSFLVDYKSPVLRDANPKKGFLFGNFSIEYQEKNPVSLKFYYGNFESGLKTYNIDLNNCTVKNYFNLCRFNVDLSDYDMQNLDYYFTIIDIANRTAITKKYTNPIDLSNPIIQEFNYTIKNKKVKFNILIDDPNFKSVSIKEKNSTINYKLLCSKLKNDHCIKEFTFSKGNHIVLIKVTDKAGNYVIKEASFTI